MRNGCRVRREGSQDELMTSAARVDGDDRLSRDGDMAAPSVRHFESVTATLADPDLRLGVSRRDDPYESSGRGVTNEVEAKTRTMSEVGAMDDVDHRNDVPARALAEQRDRRDKQAAG
jgi:hypothetical protein